MMKNENRSNSLINVGILWENMSKLLSLRLVHNLGKDDNTEIKLYAPLKKVKEKKIKS